MAMYNFSNDKDLPKITKDDDDVNNFFGNDNCRISKKSIPVNIYDVHLFGGILSLDKYSHLIDILVSANEYDKIIIHIDSYGGDLTTATALSTYIKNSKAGVLGYISGLCASAATVIFLACDEYELDENSTFMVHASSNCIYGKFNEMVSFNSFNEKYNRQVFFNVYKGFLTDEEIESVLNGADMWMLSKEVVERLEKRES